jgi:hypothetical protein
MNDVDNNVLIFRKVIERIILPKYPILESLEHIKTHWNTRVGYEYFVVLNLKSNWIQFTELSLPNLKSEIEDDVKKLFEMLGFDKTRSRGQDKVMTFIV